jgi:hypothetical protein
VTKLSASTSRAPDPPPSELRTVATKGPSLVASTRVRAVPDRAAPNSAVPPGVHRWHDPSPQSKGVSASRHWPGRPADAPARPARAGKRARRRRRRRRQDRRTRQRPRLRQSDTAGSAPRDRVHATARLGIRPRRTGRAGRAIAEPGTNASVHVRHPCDIFAPYAFPTARPSEHGGDVEAPSCARPFTRSSTG